MAKKDEQNRDDEFELNDIPDSPSENRNQAGEQGEDIGPNEVGRTNNLPDEEVERQERWQNDPDSREYFGPKTVGADDISPKNK